MSRREALTGFLRSGTASVQVETAVALLVAFPLFFTTFELCVFAYTQALLGDAARVGVRYAITHGTDSASCSGPSTGCGDTTGANVASAVSTYASSLMSGLSAATVTPTWPDGSSAPPSRVVVRVTYTYAPMLSGVTGSIAMSSTAEGRIVY
jgi:Flp pilus assembly protein TadG